MKFNDTTNYNGLIQYCEDLLDFNAGKISGNAILLKKFTNYLNIGKHNTIGKILQSVDGFDFDDTGYDDEPDGTFSLAANQRVYTLPVSEEVLQIRRLDITYDGTNYYRAERWDRESTGLGLGNDTTVDARFSKTAPRYDASGNSFFLYPRATTAEVAAGAEAKFIYSREGEEYVSTDTDQTSGIDKQFDPVIAIDACLQYSIFKNIDKKVLNLSTLLQQEIIKLEKHYGRKDRDTEYQLRAAYQDYE